jgi:hypothetical protein
LVLPEFKTETFSTVSFTNKGKRSISLPTSIDISSLPEVQFPISQNSEEYTVYLDSTPVGSPVYTPCESEETSPCFPSPSFSSFLSLDDQFPETIFPYPDTTEGLPHPFKSPPYNLQVSPSKLFNGCGGGGRWCRRRCRRRRSGQVPPPLLEFLPK